MKLTLKAVTRKMLLVKNQRQQRPQSAVVAVLVVAISLCMIYAELKSCFRTGVKLNHILVALT